MKNTELVSIIIVNWDGLRWLPDCFNSLAVQDWKNYEIIFVDNASRDTSVAWVRKHYPETKIIINKGNLGFAEANNVGYRKAKGKYVLFLNNDTRVTNNFLSALVMKLENDKTIAGAQSKLLLMDEPDRLDAIGAFLTRTGFLYHYGFHTKNTKSLDKEIELYTVKGACMIFRRNVLRKICVEGKLFDPLYFAYFEETDICHRIWLVGYRIMYIPSSVIYHKAGGTSSAMNNTFIQYHSFKNRIQSYLTNLDFSSLLIVMPTHILITIGFSCVAFLRGKIKLGFAVIRAMVWNIWYWRVTLDKRRFVNKYIRKVSDLSLFPHIIQSPGYSYFLKLAKGLSLYQHE